MRIRGADTHGPWCYHTHHRHETRIMQQLPLATKSIKQRQHLCQQRKPQWADTGWHCIQPSSHCHACVHIIETPATEICMRPCLVAGLVVASMPGSAGWQPAACLRGAAGMVAAVATACHQCAASADSWMAIDTAQHRFKPPGSIQQALQPPSSHPSPMVLHALQRLCRMLLRLRHARMLTQ